MYRIKRTLKQNGTKNDLRKRLEYVTPRLDNNGTPLWKALYEPCFEALIRYESLPLRILSRKFSFLQLRLFKKAVILFLFLTERKHFPKFSNFVSLLPLSLTNINLPMLFTIRQQFSWQLRWMQLTFTPLSRDTRLFTQGHTCVNRMQGHTCVNRKPDSNNKR
jgi:hypothetical protein